MNRYGELRVVISHLGLPPRTVGGEADPSLLRPVLNLSRFPQVHVKLSGFYALSDPGYDYPHRAAWPYVRAVIESFGISRILWGSDFSPCLDWLSFPQTLGVLEQISFMSESDRRAIEGPNLLRLLGDNA